MGKIMARDEFPTKRIVMEFTYILLLIILSITPKLTIIMHSEFTYILIPATTTSTTHRFTIIMKEFIYVILPTTTISTTYKLTIIPCMEFT